MQTDKQTTIPLGGTSKANMQTDEQTKYGDSSYCHISDTFPSTDADYFRLEPNSTDVDEGSILHDLLHMCKIVGCLLLLVTWVWCLVLMKRWIGGLAAEEDENLLKEKAKMKAERAQEKKCLPSTAVDPKIMYSHCAQCLCQESVAVRLLICGGCGVARYCSRGCQKAHYKYHKVYCQQVRKNLSVGGERRADV